MGTNVNLNGSTHSRVNAALDRFVLPQTESWETDSTTPSCRYGHKTGCKNVLKTKTWPWDTTCEVSGNSTTPRMDVLEHFAQNATVASRLTNCLARMRVERFPFETPMNGWALRYGIDLKFPIVVCFSYAHLSTVCDFYSGVCVYHNHAVDEQRLYATDWQQLPRSRLNTFVMLTTVAGHTSVVALYNTLSVPFAPVLIRLQNWRH